MHVDLTATMTTVDLPQLNGAAEAAVCDFSVLMESRS